MNPNYYYPPSWRRLDILAALQKINRLSATNFRTGLLTTTALVGPESVSAESVWNNTVLKAVGDTR